MEYVMKYDFDEVVERRGTGCLKYDFAKERGKKEDVLPLWVADMDFKTVPAVTKRLQKAVEHGIYGYSDSKEDYFAAVSGWYRDHFDWNTKQEWMIKTPGVVFALAAAVRAYTEKGDAVLIQQPVYYPFRQVIETNDRKLVSSDLVLRDGHYEIDFEDFEANIKEHQIHLFLLCSPHNPVGRVWTKQELLRLGEICKRNNIIVLADEIHNDLIHNGAEHTVFASLGDFADFTVTCTAVSKTFNLAGLACSNILISNDTIADRFKAAAERENTSCVPYFARAATIAAYTKAEQWLDELNGVIESNFNLLYSFLRTELPMLNAIRAEGTYLAWIDMRSLGLSDSALEELMLKNYLALDEGYIFGTGGSGFERWNLALPQNELKAALERLKAAVLSLQSKQ